MDFKEYFNRTSRLANVLVAIPLGVLGLLAAGAGLFIFYVLAPEFPAVAAKNRSPLIFAVFFLPVGMGCLFITWRLITGRFRKIDGGLLPPSVIFLFGLFFLIVPIYLIWIKQLLTLEAVSSLISSAACFVLAIIRKNAIINLAKKAEPI